MPNSEEPNRDESLTVVSGCRQHSGLKGYAIGLACVLVAFTLRWFLQPILHVHAPLMLFILAAMIAALCGGTGPGVLVMVFGELLGDFFFIAPYHTFGPRGVIEWAYCLTFFAETGTVILVVRALQRTRDRAQKSSLLAHERREQLREAQEALRKRFEELQRAQRALSDQNAQLIASREALEAERGRYWELFNSAPVGYIITNPQGLIQQVNAAAAALLQDAPENLGAVSLARLFPQEARAAFYGHVNRLTRQRADVVESWETTLQPHGRQPLACLVLANRVEDGRGNLLGLRWILRDISERKQVEERVLKLNLELEQRVRERTAALEAANRELEAFSYSVSHDLRAPVRSISGFSQALLEDYGDKLDAEGRQYLQLASAAGARMNRLIDDLIQLSRTSRAELRRRPVDLTALATQVVLELQKRDPSRVVDVAIEPGLRAEGDEGLLRIALENLLGNAWKFTAHQAHARIEVGASDAKGSRQFFIRDNGAGFNMAHAGRLFGVFQRLHSQEEFPGTGIGLATVRRIFARHGGKVWAEGKPNEGATFYFSLPQPVTAAPAEVPVAQTA